MLSGIIEEKFKLSDLRGKYIVLFFWPLDFSFVCTTEIIAHDHRIEQFKERNVVVVGISIDSRFTHFVWYNTPVNEGGIGPVQFPIVADVNHAIAKAYGIVQHQVVNNLPLGRNAEDGTRDKQVGGIYFLRSAPFLLHLHSG